MTLDDLALLFVEKEVLERAAQEQNSGLYCPACFTHLPISRLTMNTAGVSECVNPLTVPGYDKDYYCPLCDEYF